MGAQATAEKDADPSVVAVGLLLVLGDFGLERLQRRDLRELLPQLVPLRHSRSHLSASLTSRLVSLRTSRQRALRGVRVLGLAPEDGISVLLRRGIFCLQLLDVLAFVMQFILCVDVSGMAAHGVRARVLTELAEAWGESPSEGIQCLVQSLGDH
jgi:hypothetical protein